ncbi:hypothetical protein [Segetibacter sp.]|jgi:hypothetical protein|uniref:hypothetical protein n=1 Tax=Segetibacter sp. TaxID=2231182 RepID=UPI00262372D4|nr:hypothetical protein [Segetibacter sp.]MCW3081667.1 hypothetical protein [Segetibacter sp.]
MTSNSTYFKNVFLSIAVILLSSYCFTASAQNATPNSRVAVITNETKTNIWVSDFPKKTSIVIFDNEDNLLSVVSTNDFGAAFVTLPTSIKTSVIVKTLNGEVRASNQVAIKNQEEQTVVAGASKEASKA